jgi:hypothetical protein
MDSFEQLSSAMRSHGLLADPEASDHRFSSSMRFFN